MPPPTDIAHIVWLVAIVGVLWVLVLILAGAAVRNALGRLSDKIAEHQHVNEETAKSVQTALETARDVETERWDRYETDMRVFRGELTKHETRLSRLEGKHYHFEQKGSPGSEE